MKARIAVLMGGRSLERSVSLMSGRRVARALKERDYDVITLDVDETLVPTLLSEKPALVYIALHGKDGEDGTIQELLQLMNIPYTGPGPLASIIGFNKVLSKELFMANGIPAPRYYTLSSSTVEDMGASTLLPRAWEKLGGPVVVKPSAQGSALGVSIVNRPEDLGDALVSALGYDDRVLIEEYIEGCEVSVSVLGNRKPEALPAVEVVPESGFFDFEARYSAGKTKYFAPARLSDNIAADVRRTALATHELLGCKDLSRTDIIIGEGNVPYVLELNISPGMTETSLLPLAAEAAGLSFADLVEKLVKLSLD
ncbi:MAG: D-alanine--D-alanine ligase [Actinobacteria bacterium]|nr:D-alanine--D-alanine ligase [Actinomycetota bacterium]MCG2817689.1 D-alanine--D-alanine ligase [Actinomycetes bacterium]MBU4179271.1 D-alanine--D-alanine ligase [Actinomycetota bacterium]MBU4217481.1 D-alanine--D-alanine ligase [Actinomycetota bacterium]MBU4358186.1 D-alanine--D-alanine ligase [Actinomycetota bacterium]